MGDEGNAIEAVDVATLHRLARHCVFPWTSFDLYCFLAFLPTLSLVLNLELRLSGPRDHHSVAAGVCGW